MDLGISWDSNPFAYGAIHCRIKGRKSSVGGISNVNGLVKGWFLGKLVYEGDSEDEAMLAVEHELKLQPEHIIREFLD